MTDPPLPADLQARNDEATVVKAEAEAAKAKADAEKAAADADAARRAGLLALVPDLSKVKDSTLDVKDGPAIRASSLTFGALHQVTEQVATRVAAVVTRPARILVTSQVDLSSVDAIYFDVVKGLEELRDAAHRLIEPEPRHTELEPFGVTAALDLAGAVATAVPQVLSLFSAQRTLSTAAVSASDLAAAAEVAGALRAQDGIPVVLHDDFRLVNDGPVYALAAEVSARRQQLIERRLTLDAGEAANIAVIEKLVDAIDAFLAGVHAVPAGATKSPIAFATLHELLHDSGSSRLTHVLLVKMEAGQSQQVLEDRPLWFQDKYSTIVDLSITYILIATDDSQIVTAGSATGTASAYGKIGEPPTLRVVT
jgi:hypothetical protein